MLYRAQILLEPEQHRALGQIAEQEGRSISEVVRFILREYLAQRERQVQHQGELQALETLHKIRKTIQEKHGIYQGNLLQEVRVEREADFERVMKGEE